MMLSMARLEALPVDLGLVVPNSIRQGHHQLRYVNSIDIMFVCLQ